jgi:hypothetical protein
MLMLAIAALTGAQDPLLDAAIEATRRFEVEGQPCLARPDDWPVLSAAERRRQREVRSDSHWLNRFVRQQYADRLAFSGLVAGAGGLRHIVWLTGAAPVPPLRLTHRAADVPVEVRYGAPWSLEEVSRRRVAAAPARARLVPDANGEGYREGPDGGYVSLDVYSPDGRPRADVLAQCEKLRQAYRLPVLITFTAGRVTLQ